MSSKHWVVALGTSGEVLGVAQGAPAEWVGASLSDRAGVPASLRDAARAAVAAARSGAEALAKATVEVVELDAVVEIVAVPAVGLHRSATDVRALLHSAVATLERQARACDFGLRITIDPAVPAKVFVDPEKLAWAVSALVGNAMRYVRRGTRHLPGGSIAVTARHEAGDLVIVVEDDGPGIPADVVDRLFQRAPGAPHATGLALGVVRDIVAAHGGSVKITSSTEEPDQGTTVTLRMGGWV